MDIKKILNETLYGPVKDTRGVIEFTWSRFDDAEIDEWYGKAKEHLERAGVDTKFMKLSRDARKITIVTNQNMANDIIEIMGTFGFDAVDTIFDTKNPEEDPDDYYPNRSNVQG
jgi:hypothetical protein